MHACSIGRCQTVRWLLNLSPRLALQLVERNLLEFTAWHLGAPNFYYTDSTVHYHRLPLNNKPLLKQWIQKMKLKDPPVNKHSRVCGAHFLDEDYITKGSFHDGIFTQEKTSRLKDTAVPTVFDFSKYQCMLINKVPLHMT